MPLLLYKSELNAEVAVWKATETLSFYKEQLSIHHFPAEKANEIKHPEKVRQWYASRYLLCEIFPGAIQLYKNRKPILFNGPEISFSHTGDIVAVMLSSFRTGIDIQLEDPKLGVIEQKFVNPEDLSPFENGGTVASNERTKISTLCKIWAIKEAIFKLYVTELPFKNITIKDINLKEKKAVVSVKRKGELKTHNLSLIDVDGVTLAYVRE